MKQLPCAFSQSSNLGLEVDLLSIEKECEIELSAKNQCAIYINLILIALLGSMYHNGAILCKSLVFLLFIMILCQHTYIKDTTSPLFTLKTSLAVHRSRSTISDSFALGFSEG